MSFVMKIRTKGGYTDLTPEQFALAEPVIVRMMNGETRPKQAEAEIIELLAKAGKPVEGAV